jgi:hypothetical protein
LVFAHCFIPSLYFAQGCFLSVVKVRPFSKYNGWWWIYLGLANVKTVDISAGEEGAITVTTPRLKLTKNPAISKHTDVIKKQTRKALKGIKKQVSHIRPDLTVGSTNYLGSEDE